MGFRGHDQVDKQCGEATSSSGRDYMEGKKSLNTTCTPVTIFIFYKSVNKAQINHHVRDFCLLVLLFQQRLAHNLHLSSFKVELKFYFSLI